MYQVALKMLVGDKAKYYGLIFGIAMATFLMAQQVSIFIGIMLHTASQIIDVYEADVWVMHPDVSYIDEIKSMRDIDLYRTRSVGGVAWAVPFFKGSGVIRYTGNLFQQVILLGIDDTTLIGAPPKMIVGKWEDLKLPDSLIMDRAGWQMIWGNEPFQKGRTIEMNGKRIVIVGLCSATAPFLTFPLVVTRYSLATQLASTENNAMSFVLVKTLPQVTPEQVAHRIEQKTGLKALTSAQFIRDSINHYLIHTGIPINFGITIALGFLIGASITGQTFYLFIRDNLRQFAAIKAMGVTNQQLFSMVLTQAAIVGYIGFSIGIGITAIYFDLTGFIIILRDIYLTGLVILGTGFSILLIMLLTTFISIHKVLVLAPADVFKG